MLWIGRELDGRTCAVDAVDAVDAADAADADDYV